MWSRLLALVLVVALVPAIEVTEQVVHVVEHVLHGDDGAHSAHHDEAPGGCEHCGGLVHVCATHQVPALAPLVAVSFPIEQARRAAVTLPSTLRDLALREPADRPPIS